LAGATVRLEQGFIDLRREEVITSAVLVDELLELIREDADYFGSKKEVDNARIILARGTSADRQLAIYRQERTAASPVHAP
jgi:carboxylate-amine ligase